MTVRYRRLIAPVALFALVGLCAAGCSEEKPAGEATPASATVGAAPAGSTDGGGPVATQMEKGAAGSRPRPR
jgi:hypothetical protein